MQQPKLPPNPTARYPEPRTHSGDSRAARAGVWVPVTVFDHDRPARVVEQRVPPCEIQKLAATVELHLVEAVRRSGGGRLLHHCAHGVGIRRPGVPLAADAIVQVPVESVPRLPLGTPIRKRVSLRHATRKRTHRRAHKRARTHSRAHTLACSHTGMHMRAITRSTTTSTLTTATTTLSPILRQYDTAIRAEAAVGVTSQPLGHADAHNASSHGNRGRSRCSRAVYRRQRGIWPSCMLACICARAVRVRAHVAG